MKIIGFQPDFAFYVLQPFSVWDKDSQTVKLFSFWLVKFLMYKPFAPQKLGSTTVLALKFNNVIAG